MRYTQTKHHSSLTRGFSILEMIIAIGIFALLTTLLVAKYGNFNRGLLITNLAFDVALEIRNAQSNSINVKYGTAGYDYPYGVHFTSVETADPELPVYPANTLVTSFVDVSPDTPPFDGHYNYDSDSPRSRLIIKRGSKIDKICVGKNEYDCTLAANEREVVDITFRRPNPNAIITSNGEVFDYTEIRVKAADNNRKRIIVRSTGQIEVQDIFAADGDTSQFQE